MAHLEIRNAGKFYGKKIEVLKGINLEAEQGEFVVLVGPSGCGKSTLLRMIAGLEEITSGDIYIAGRHVNNLAPADRDIAMVFQDYALYPHMTVEENLSFGLRIKGVPAAEIKERVQFAARMLRIEPFLDRRPAQLSGGQRQRVAIGRATVRKPSLFLFDEPLSNLDASLRSQMRIELAELHQRVGTTSVYVTHDQVEAMTLATRIVILNKGVVQQVGAPLDVYHRPANTFVAGFIGSPAMNFFTGELTFADGKKIFRFDELTLDVSRLPAPKTPGTYILGLRPEAIKVIPQHAAEFSEHLDLHAKVILMEPHGHETHLIASIGKQQAIIRTSNPRRLEVVERAKAGDLLPCTLDNAEIHWFQTEGDQHCVDQLA